MDQSPQGIGAQPRRGPSVDVDPSGIVTGKSPDRQRRQFLNYAFYRLDPVRDTPMFACAKAPIDAILAQLANMD